jgi:acyl carrier protein
MEEKIKNVMAAVFEVQPSQVDDNASPDTIDKWDSLGHMNLIVALEEEFGTTFSDDEIPEMLNFKIIQSTLKSKLG